MCKSMIIFCKWTVCEDGPFLGYVFCNIGTWFRCGKKWDKERSDAFSWSNGWYKGGVLIRYLIISQFSYRRRPRRLPLACFLLGKLTPYNKLLYSFVIWLSICFYSLRVRLYKTFNLLLYARACEFTNVRVIYILPYR